MKKLFILFIFIFNFAYSNSLGLTDTDLIILKKIKTLTVGNGITINGNEITVNFGVDLFPNDYLVDIYFDKIVEKGLLLRSY